MGSDYSKSLFKELTEQIKQVEKLDKENKKLRNENTELRIENKRLSEKADVLEASIEEKTSAAIEKAVSQATSPLIDELNKAYKEISRLKAIINKDSSNSSKPSSTNGFKAVTNLREKSGKSQGGQKGHIGHRLKLPNNMKELEAKGILEMRTEYHTEESTDSSSSYISRYTIDVETKIIITEHLYKDYSDIPPEHYNEASYGNNIKAQVVLLSNEGVVANKRLSEIISSLSHGEVINTDDTPMRTLERIVYPEDENSAPIYEKAEKKSFRATVRTHSNESSTLYTVNPRKDKAGVERDGILPQYMGNLCHDHESKFYNYGSNNGTCGAHLLRELKGLELSRIQWAENMIKLVCGLNDYKNEDLARGSSFCDAEKLSFFEREYDRIIEEGHMSIAHMNKGGFGYNEFNAMLNRLLKHKDNYMLFMHNYKVPFTNNLAERDL